MDGVYKWRVAIKFCFKAGLSTTETLVLVQRAFGNEAVNLSNVFRLYFRFWDGRELVDDDERGGHPKSTQNEVNIAAVADLVKNDHWITSRMITETLKIPKTVVLQILKGDLGNRKLYACLFHTPWHLSEGKIESHLAKALSHKNFFNKIITGDETWCFACDPETKRQSSEWVGKTSSRPKKLKFQRSRIKTMLIIFFQLSRRSAQRIRTRGKKQ